jgi:transposase
MAEVMATQSVQASRSWPKRILATLDAQTVQVPGTDELGRVVASLARRVLGVLAERDGVAAALEARLDGHPAAKVMASTPGIATNSAARLIATIDDGGGFRTADQLAAYAGLAPVTRQSGMSINSQRHDRRGNRRIKNVFFNAALSALIPDPNSRRYYDKKRAEGKHHTVAMLCLARRRLNVMHAMLRTGSHYRAVSEVVSA